MSKSYMFLQLVKSPVMLCLVCLTLVHGPKASADKKPRPYNNPAQQRAWNQRTQQFERLWLSRRRVKVVPQLLTMLAAEPTPYLREHIVMALGIIENPQAIKPLQNLLAQAQNPKIWRDEVPAFRVRLAIGRIRSYNLRGKSKINTIAREVGKSWPSLKQDAKRLRLKLKERAGIYEVQKSEDKFILDEFLDVLYRMRKRGENIRQLGAQEILLWPQQASSLEAGSLSDAAEVKFWLKRAVPPSGTGFHPAHLLDLGPTVQSELLRHLKLLLTQAQNDPNAFAKTSVYDPAFQAAAQTRNRGFLPVLKGFLNVKDSWTRSDAGDAVHQLESGKNVVAFP